MRSVAVAHPGQAAEGGVFAAIAQPVVDLVGDHDQVVFRSHGSDFLHPFEVQHCAGWVVGIVDQDGSRAGRDRGLDLRARHLERGVNVGGDGHGDAAGEAHLCFVGDEARLGDDHLVAGVQDGRQRQVERLGAANGHQRLRFRVVDDAIELRPLGSDRLPQLQDAGVGGVARLPAAQRSDAGLADHRRRDEIRLADAQRDDVLHRRGDVEEFADAGRRHSGHPARNAIRHGFSFNGRDTGWSALLLDLPACSRSKGI